MKYTKTGENIPRPVNYQKAIKHTKWPEYRNSKWQKISQYFLFQGPSKIIQIWIFGLKINHLATLLGKQNPVFVPYAERRRCRKS
jgi:hypothetical protein